MKKIIIFLQVFFVIALLNITSSCYLYPANVLSVTLENENSHPVNSVKPPEVESRLWSILIYMAADNSLDDESLNDIYEMEISKLNTDKVSVFILLDRKETDGTGGSDENNRNYGTKLYKLETGRSQDCNWIISKEIACEPIGIYENSNTELNTASVNNLSKCLAYIKENYPSVYLGFIMWGHGTGWKGINNDDGVKAFAFDDSHKSYMSLKQFGTALKSGMKGGKLDFLGLDTCFGGEIEVMYELRNIANYAVGTPGLLSTSGWNYKLLFDMFENCENKTPKELVSKVVKQFSDSYGTLQKAGIVGVDMKYMETYFNSFDNFTKLVSNEISSRKIRDDVMNILISENSKYSKLYGYGGNKSDIYSDIGSMVIGLSEYFNSNGGIKAARNDYEEAAKDCFIDCWCSDNNKGSLGVYLGTLANDNFISYAHPEDYKKGKTLEQIQFVQDSNGYVPNMIGNESLLGKLFYYEY